MVRKIDFADDLLPLLEAEAARLKTTLSGMVNMLLAGPVPAPSRPALGPSPAPAQAGPGLGETFKEGGEGDTESPNTPPSRKAGRAPRTPRVSSPQDGELVLFPEPLSAYAPAAAHRQPGRRTERDRERAAELAWRVAQVWEAHLYAWRAFMRDKTGVEPRHTPALHPEDIERPIRDALLMHDRDRLGPRDREIWRTESPVLAAGIGIFYDPWCSGSSADNDANNGGKRFIEHWRPWKRQKGKADPVIRFADLCFETRDVRAIGGEP